MADQLFPTTDPFLDYPRNAHAWYLARMDLAQALAYYRERDPEFVPSDDYYNFVGFFTMIVQDLVGKLVSEAHNANREPKPTAVTLPTQQEVQDQFFSLNYQVQSRQYGFTFKILRGERGAVTLRLLPIDGGAAMEYQVQPGPLHIRDWLICLTDLFREQELTHET